MTKVEQNRMANLNMNVLGIVWQIIHYFTGKQGLVFQSAMVSNANK